MTSSVDGIHHVSCIADDAEENMDFEWRGWGCACFG